MRRLLLAALLASGSASAATPDDRSHLFILSGQSNMAGLDPDISFVPAVEKVFGKEKVLVVKDAQGGQPIRRWHKAYRYPDGREIQDRAQIGDLYDRLLAKVKAAAAGRTFDTVTFVWMQGERDAKEALGDVYATAFKGILEQLKADLKQERLRFVIGRLSDFDLPNASYPHWTRIREIQVKLAEESPDGAWIDCDDLNDGKNKVGKEIRNDLHMSVEGYRRMGERFAEKAVALLRRP